MVILMVILFYIIRTVSTCSNTINDVMLFVDRLLSVGMLNSNEVFMIAHTGFDCCPHYLPKEGGSYAHIIGHT